MWFFKSKDLRDYSCDFKNSKRFWNFSENARSVFFCFRFWSTELHEPAQWTFWLLVLRPENFKFSNPKISGTIHTIRIIFADPETSTKMLDRFFLFFDFDRRNLTNELHEVFVFLVRAHELLMLNWLLPLISLGLTAWMGLFWLSHTKTNCLAQVHGNQWTERCLSFFSANSQCWKLPEPL